MKFTFILLIQVLTFSLVGSAQSGVNFWPHWEDGWVEVDGYHLVTYSDKSPPATSLLSLAFYTKKVSRITHQASDSDTAVGDVLPSMKMISSWGSTNPPSKLEALFPLRNWNLASQRYRSILPLETRWKFPDRNEYMISKGEWFEHSFGDGKIPRPEVPRVATGLFEDDLLFRVRELMAPFPSGRYSILPSPRFDGHGFAGDPDHWTDAQVGRTVSMRPVKTPIGEVPVVSFEIEFAERIYHIVVEGTAEKRVLSWEVSSADDPDRRIESAELFGTLRGAKWREILDDQTKLTEALKAL